MLRRILIPIFFAYAGLVTVLYVRQDSLIFPRGGAYETPIQADVGEMKEVWIKTSDDIPVLFWHAPATPGLPTIVYFHGNVGTVSRRKERYQFYLKHGLGVLAMEFRGYGIVAGTPSEQAFVEDAQTVYGWLEKQGVAPQSIVIVGESLGSGVATALAARKAGAALLLEAPYSSVTDVASDRYWFVPVSLLLKHHFDAKSVIHKVKMPILIQHGTADETVPFQYGRALFDAAPEPKEFISVEGADHRIFNEPTWRNEIAFLRRHLNLAIPIIH